jgi:ketosteroid isomerase-like protein
MAGTIGGEGLEPRDAFRDEIMKRQHDGEAALVQGDVRPRLGMWSHTDPVSLFAAVGPTKTGWAELEPTFHAVASRLSGGHDVRYELLAFDVGEDVAWTAGVASFVVSMDGRPPEAMAIPLTHAYRREYGEWKVVHEHSDFQPANQIPDAG